MSEYSSLLGKIGEIINSARRRVLQAIDATQVSAYWQIGMAIVEYEQRGKKRAEYGGHTLIKLSCDLADRFGKGFSVDNLQNMRRLYIKFPNLFQIYEAVSRKSGQLSKSRKYGTVSRILSWSHYCELLKEDNNLARGFYEKEAIGNNWSVRELKRQMNFYLNYFKQNERAPDENDPIGLILGAKKDEVFVKYILGGMSNKIFASRYKLALPSEKQLYKQLGFKK